MLSRRGESPRIALDTPPPAERTLARGALRVGAWIVAPAVLIGWFVSGPAGALTAFGGVALVVLNFYVTGQSLAWASKFSPIVVQAVALGGFFLRLVFFAVAIVVLSPVQAIDGPVLALTVVVATVVLLSYEVRLAMRHAEFWWVNVADGKEAA